MWAYSLDAKTWTLLKGSTSPYGTANYGSEGINDTPGDLVNTAFAYDGKQYFYVFGGQRALRDHDCVVGDGCTAYSPWYNRFFQRNEIWRFNIANNRWAFLDGDKYDDSIGAVTGLPLKPSARSGATMVYAATATPSLYLYGGSLSDTYNVYPTEYNMWRYNTGTKVWSIVNTGNNPGKIWYHASFFDLTTLSMYVVAGTSDGISKCIMQRSKSSYPG